MRVLETGNFATGSLDSELLCDDLQKNGYALVDHGIPEDAIDEVIACYADFTDNFPDPSYELLSAMLPDGNDPIVLEKQLDDLDRSKDTQREWHKYRTNQAFVGKPLGHSDRLLATKALQIVRGVEIANDPKKFFHYMPDALAQLHTQHRERSWGPIPREVGHLHLLCSGIHKAATTAIARQYALLEDSHPELTAYLARPTDLMRSPLRILAYHEGQGDLLARGHYDKSVGTLQIAESHVGLRILNPTQRDEEFYGEPTEDPRMQLLRRPANKGVFFPGFNHTLHYPDSPIKGAWHDVVNHPDANAGRKLHGRGIARWALILFTNSFAIDFPSKDAVHNEDTLKSLAH
jgi:hypothetical protein